MLENLRLRARYESQLQAARSLEALYHNQTSFADLDVRYAQTDTIFDSTGLSYIDYEMVRGMHLKRDERGHLCFEHLQAKLLPFDSRVIDRVFWECASREEFRKHHGVYQVRLATEDTILTKMVDPLQLPHAETMTLTICTAMKRFIESDRVVAVWEALVTTSGSVSMQLRESGWNILRPTSARIPHHTGPMSIIQTCVRIVPELQHAYSEQDLAVGTLTNLIVGSYHRHKEMMHQVSEDLLVTQFDMFHISK
uniref:START domain-containing protein n=1 Tax=Globisporangium ultimum (strain ATCC 200006 / CBS 805.95 / DAOM BR144) TaxID=431595 RepID=K3W921_GLOUD